MSSRPSVYRLQGIPQLSVVSSAYGGSTMLKWVHGLIERLALRVYQSGARQLGAQSAEWKDIEIISNPAVLPKIIDALDSVGSGATIFSQLVQRNLKTIICANGVMTKTLPVTRTFLINSAPVDALEKRNVAYLLVQSAAYIDFYTGRSFFLPTVFFRKRDQRARSEAQRIAMEFQNMWANNA